MNYLIRNCQSSDIPFVVYLCQKHAEYEKAIFNPFGKEEGLTKALFSDDPKLFCLVVEVEQKIVGYATYTIDFSTWDAAYFMYMDCLYLEDEVRGFGIGEALLDVLTQVATSKKCITIQWHTPTFNERAIKFYHRIGGKSKNKVRFFLDV